MPPEPDHTEAWFALGGALGAAGIVGLLGYLQSRLQRSAERERLTQQLDHERALDDRAYLRQVVEDTNNAYEGALDGLFSWKAAVDLCPKPDDDEAGRIRAVQAQAQAADTASAFYVAKRRLDLWLPRESQMGDLLGTLAEGLNECQGALKGTPPLSEEAGMAYEAALAKTVAAHWNFITAVRAEAGALV